LSKLDEIYRLHRLLDGRRTGLPRAALIAEHGFSRSTLTRLIADLRDKLGAPIVYDLERGGYRYDTVTVSAMPCGVSALGISKKTVCGNRKTRGKPRVLDSVHPFRDNLIAATALTPESYN